MLSSPFHSPNRQPTASWFEKLLPVDSASLDSRTYRCFSSIDFARINQTITKRDCLGNALFADGTIQLEGPKSENRHFDAIVSVMLSMEIFARIRGAPASASVLISSAELSP